MSWDGVQPTKHQNGLSSNGEAADFEEIIKLSNHSGSGSSGQGQPADPIMAFEGGEPFMMKAGPMKPQHVAGKILDIISLDKIFDLVIMKTNDHITVKKICHILEMGICTKYSGFSVIYFFKM